MSLESPLGLLALAALGPLLLTYFLRRREKPRIVSALFLWRAPSRTARAGPRFERFSRELSLLLESAAILCAALFLANLRFGKFTRKHSVMVLDGSFSMQARTDGETAAERAIRAVTRSSSEDAADLLTIVESGPHPRLIAGPQADKARALAALSGWRPGQASHDVVPALMLARELSTTKGQRIRFLTDGPLSSDRTLPVEVDVESVGIAAENFAFLSAQRHDENGVAQVTLRVASFSKERRSVGVVVSNQDVNQREEVELEPGASSVVRLALRTNKPLTAALPSDALVLDSEIVLPASPVLPVTLGLRPGLDAVCESSLRQFIAVTPGVRAATGAETGSDAQPIFSFGPPGTEVSVSIGARGKLHSFVGPFFVEKSDPLLEDVHFSGVVWTAGESPAGRPLISMGDVYLLTQDPDGRMHVNVDLARSNVQRTAAWPVLLANLVRSARSNVPSFSRKIVMLGESVDIVVSAQGRSELATPSGTRRALLGFAARLPVDEAGEWKLFQDGRLVDSLSVLPLDERESDLLTRGKYQIRARASGGTASQPDSPRPRWLLGALLVLVLLDFWITASARATASRKRTSLQRAFAQESAHPE